MDNLILYLSSVVLGGAGAWLISRWGTTIDLLDRSNDRSSHEGVVPKGGGIGILAAFVFSSMVLKIPAGFWISATFFALFSLWGDRVELSPKIRLPAQFIAALILLAVPVYSDSSFAFCPLISDLQPWTSVLCLLPLSVFVVGTANYYNFMDGINGIAGITGVVAFGLLGWFAAVEGADSGLITLCICLGLACIGFLPFNMPKARVFMGDVGSILLGFVFAGVVVWLSRSFLDFVCISAFLFPFYADELTTLVVRIKDGELPEVRGQRSVAGKRQGQRSAVGGRKSEDEGQKEGMSGLMGRLMKPHRRHLYQLLANERGIAHWKVSVGYGVLQLVVGVSVISVKGYGLPIVLSMLALYFAAFAVAVYYIRSAVKAGLRSADSADYTD